MREFIGVFFFYFRFSNNWVPLYPENENLHAFKSVCECVQRDTNISVCV